MFDGKFYKEWRLFVYNCTSINYIDGFYISSSYIVFDDNSTYFHLIWSITNGIDYECAFGIISEVFSGYKFTLSPISVSEVDPYEE